MVNSLNRIVVKLKIGRFKRNGSMMNVFTISRINELTI